MRNDRRRSGYSPTRSSFSVGRDEVHGAKRIWWVHCPRVRWVPVLRAFFLGRGNRSTFRNRARSLCVAFACIKGRLCVRAGCCAVVQGEQLWQDVFFAMYFLCRLPLRDRMRAALQHDAREILAQMRRTQTPLKIRRPPVRGLPIWGIM